MLSVKTQPSAYYRSKNTVVSKVRRVHVRSVFWLNVTKLFGHVCESLGNVAVHVVTGVMDNMGIMCVCVYSLSTYYISIFYTIGTVSSIQFLLTLANPRFGNIYDIFRYRKKAWTCLYIKQLYSRYAYIAYREYSHVSMEAQLILNNFLVYKTLCIQV